MRWIHGPGDVLVAYGKKTGSVYWITKVTSNPHLETPPGDYPVGLHRHSFADRLAGFSLVGACQHYHEAMLEAQRLEDGGAPNDHL